MGPQEGVLGSPRGRFGVVLFRVVLGLSRGGVGLVLGGFGGSVWKLVSIVVA